MDQPSFSADDAVKTQLALRQAMGLGPEAFPLPAFVGMISDEIAQLRAAGRSDAEIATLIEGAIGRRVDEAAIGQFYASEADRHRG